MSVSCLKLFFADRATLLLSFNNQINVFHHSLASFPEGSVGHDARRGENEELGWALFTDGAADSLWEGLLGISGGGRPHQSSLGSSLLPRVSTPRSAETCSNGGVSTTDTIKNSHSEDKQGACSCWLWATARCVAFQRLPEWFLPPPPRLEMSHPSDGVGWPARRLIGLFWAQLQRNPVDESTKRQHSRSLKQDLTCSTKLSSST